MKINEVPQMYLANHHNAKALADRQVGTNPSVVPATTVLSDWEHPDGRQAVVARTGDRVHVDIDGKVSCLAASVALAEGYLGKRGFVCGLR